MELVNPPIHTVSTQPIPLDDNPSIASITTTVCDTPSIIWKQSNGAGSTGSVLVKLAQKGYTREAHKIIELSRIASLVGRDSEGGLTELWDIMGQVRGKNGITRLMAIAITRGSLSLDRAKALIRDHNADPIERDDFGRAALHHSLGSKHAKDAQVNNLFDCNKSLNVELTRYLITVSSQVLSIKVSGKTPLHLALENNAPIDILKLLIEKCPEALKERDYDELLPCHLVCTKNFSASLDVVTLIVEADPLALQERDIRGRLPLHFACSSNASYEIVKFLIDSYPQAVKEKVDRGRLPLHLACMHLSPFEVIKLLVVSYEEALQENKNFEGKLPLHDAYKAPFEVYKCLLEKFPDARLMCDNSGRLPSSYLTPNSPALALFN